MRIVLVGASGQLGYELQKRAQVLPFDKHKLDVTSSLCIESVLGSTSFDVLINASGYTKTGLAEKEKEQAYRLNTEAPALLANFCAKKGACFFHLSTDFVFDGEKTTPYTEEDPTNPLSYYGLTKREGEKLVQASLANAWIFRTASLFGLKGPNFLQTLAKKQERSEPLCVVNDIWMSPTYAGDLASWILQALEKNLPFGLYHAVHQGQASWYDLAKEFFPSSPIEPLSSHTLTSLCQAPKYSVLSSKNLETFLGPLPTWQEGVSAYREALEKEALCGKC